MVEPMSDPSLWPMTDQLAALAARTLSACELFDAQLASIERHNPAINAVVTLDAERGRAAAERADARPERNGPLDGLLISVKDALDVAAMRATGGAIEFRDRVATADADVVAKVRAAGAEVFAKTNVPRWSGDLQTFNEIFGTTNNPWNTAMVPGGSSGGPAAAVATGMTAFEIGTDIGGSIRVPAAYCGVVGHKPSYGLVPCGGYLDSVHGGHTEPDINVHGPIARSVGDLELLLDVMAGPRPDRHAAWHLGLPEPRRSALDGLRVAVWSDDEACRVSQETRDAIDQAAELLDGEGAHVDSAARPAIDADGAARLGNTLVVAAISPSWTDDEAAERPISHRDWLAMDRRRTAIRGAWANFFDQHDVLLCPVIARPPFPHQQDGDFTSRVIDIDGSERPYADLVWWTILIGMAYLPSTVIPIGQTADGLPIAMQIVGPYLEDRTTLAFAREFVDLLGPIKLPAVNQ